MFKEKAQTQCSSIPMAQQNPLNSPAINLVSFPFTLLEKRRKKLSEKEKQIFLLYLLLLSSTEDLVKRESGGKISPEVCRKLYPTWSSQCKKQQKGSCTGAVVVNGFWSLPLFIYLHFFWEQVLTSQPVPTLRPTKTVGYLRDWKAAFKTQFIQVA